MKTKTFFIFFIILLSDISISQPSFVWSTRFDGTEHGIDYLFKTLADKQGNIYVTGSVINSGTGRDVTTIKYDSSGNRIWVKPWNGSSNGDDNANSMAIDNLGNIYVAGNTYTGSYCDFLVIKYDPNGNEIWHKTFDGPQHTNDAISAIFVDDLGNVYVTGSCHYTSNSNSDILTIEYDSAGSFLWGKNYNGGGNLDDVAISIKVFNNQITYIAGYTYSAGSNYDYILLEYDNFGTITNTALYNGNANSRDIPGDIYVDNNGIVYVTGVSTETVGGQNYLTIKYSPHLQTEIWKTNYSGPAGDNDIAGNLVVDGLGNVFVSGQSKGNGTNYDFATIKYNPNGNQQWVKRYNGPGNGDDIVNSILIDPYGDVYVSGSSEGNLTSYDFKAIKYSNQGVEFQYPKYDGTANDTDYVTTAGINKYNGMLYVGGYSKGIGTRYDYALVKYSQQNYPVIGITKLSTELPKDFSLFQNYPNPFNPITKIKFDIPYENGLNSNVKLFVYDILGKEVRILINEKLTPGSYETEFSGVNLSSGIYFYKLETGDYNEIKKMVLSK